MFVSSSQTGSRAARTSGCTTLPLQPQTPVGAGLIRKGLKDTLYLSIYLSFFRSLHLLFLIHIVPHVIAIW